MQVEKAHGADGCYSGISEQTVQHKDTRLTGIKWSRREKGGKELYGHQRQTQIPCWKFSNDIKLCLLMLSCRVSCSFSLEIYLRLV